MNFQNQNNFQAYQNQNMNNQAMNNQASAMNNRALANQTMTNQGLDNQTMNNQTQLQNEAAMSNMMAGGYNAQPDMELGADLNQKTAGEIQRILASKAVTGIEFGYIPFPESGPNQMNNQANINTQYHNANAEMKIAQR